MKMKGTVEVVEQDAAAHRAVLRVKAREVGGQGHANADVTFQLNNGGGTVHTSAQITGKAASMGEGVVIGVLDGLITDFTSKLGEPDASAHPASLTPDARWRPSRCARSATAKCPSPPGRLSRRTPTARPSAATAPTTTAACGAATSSPRGCTRCRWPKEGPGPLRALLDAVAEEADAAARSAGRPRP